MAHDDTPARERLQEWLVSLFPRDIHDRDKDSSGYYAARNSSGPSPKQTGDSEYRAQIRYYFGAIRPAFIGRKLSVVSHMLKEHGIPYGWYTDSWDCPYLLVDLENYRGPLPTLPTVAQPEPQPTDPPAATE